LISPLSNLASSSTARLRSGISLTSARKSSERIEMSGFRRPASGEDVHDLVGSDGHARRSGGWRGRGPRTGGDRRWPIWKDGANGLEERDVVQDRHRLVGRHGQREGSRQRIDRVLQPLLPVGATFVVTQPEDVLLRPRSTDTRSAADPRENADQSKPWKSPQQTSYSRRISPIASDWLCSTRPRPPLPCRPPAPCAARPPNPGSPRPGRPACRRRRGSRARSPA